jgi:hypothetical protein
LDLARQAFKLPVPKTSARGGEHAGLSSRGSRDHQPGRVRALWGGGRRTHDIGSGLRAAHAIESELGPGQPGLGQAPGQPYGGYKESGIGEFSLEDMLDSFTQRKNVTVNLNTPRLA